MNFLSKVLISVFFLIFSITHLVSQSYEIQDIVITGNKHSKSIIIFRELDFELGDSIDLVDLANRLDNNEKRLLSTGLFNLCDINIKKIDELTHKVIVSINVKENWFIYPAPIFELADRSFNVWSKEFNYSLSRINYGVRLDHTNTFGYKDRLKLKAQFGFTKKYELFYNSPYLLKDWGLQFGLLFSQNKELGYATIGNVLRFKKYEDEAILLKRFKVSTSIYKRFNAFADQTLKLEFINNSVNERINKELNPDYFPNGANYIKYLRLSYAFDYDKTVFPAYPEGGYALGFILLKDGLGFGNYNAVSLYLDAERYTKLSQKLIVGGNVRGGHTFINGKIPFSNNSAIGYNQNVLRGYELYVLDGQTFGWYKTAIRYNLLDQKINLGKFMPIKAFNVLPLKIFLRASFEGGYSYEPTYINTNTLNNRHVYGGGPGIDLLLLNTSLFSIEYNGNVKGEWGFYFKGGFKI